MSGLLIDVWFIKLGTANKKIQYFGDKSGGRKDMPMVKKHTMKLAPSPMKKIRDGKKTIELRLYDDKRKQISVGDIIIFVNRQDADDRLQVTVKNLFVFKSFAELYKNLPLLKCGYTEDDVNDASPKDMEAYYSEEKENQYGVVGIEISLK